jgi:MraZ protein
VVKSGDFFLLLAQQQTQNLINLTGTYECKADAKGRLMISSAFKKQLSPVLQEGFVVKRAVFQPCLELYPMQEWNLMMSKINKLNRFVKKNNDFIRRFTAGVKVVDMDASGRLLIPKDLCVFAGIEKKVVLSSAINIIEIWDKDKYEKAIDDAAVDFADLAEEVMGNTDIDELS